LAQEASLVHPGRPEALVMFTSNTSRRCLSDASASGCCRND
jgi:hypothetical protein